MAISKEAMELLGELTVIPQVVGYDHRIRELDEAQPRLIQWVVGQGYFVSDAGRALLSGLAAPVRNIDPSPIEDVSPDERSDGWTDPVAEWESEQEYCDRAARRA